MEERIRTSEITAHVGTRVRVAGWLQSMRRLGSISFLVLRDGWGVVQAVAETDTEMLPLQSDEVGVESIITIEGNVTSSEQAPGGIELHDLQIEVLNPIAAPPPISLNKRKINAQLATLLDHAPVANRHLTRRAIFRLHAGVMAGFRDILTSRGFTEIQTPKIVAAATESGASVFKLDYFGRPAYLAQSPQFYKLRTQCQEDYMIH